MTMGQPLEDEDQKSWTGTKCNNDVERCSGYSMIASSAYISIDIDRVGSTYTAETEGNHSTGHPVL